MEGWQEIMDDYVPAGGSYINLDMFLIGLTGALPHGPTFEHPEHSPAWNCCYTGKKTLQTNNTSQTRR